MLILIEMEPLLHHDSFSFGNSCLFFFFFQIVETLSCTRSNKCGNKAATQGWIADVVVDKFVQI